ncbi:MAG: hypothetical protein IKK18_03615 [Clostridia bacterium]|nr:hypothetical protein [Clostridia bacterium]
MGYSNLAYKYEEDYSFREEAEKKAEAKVVKAKKKNFTPIICALVLSMAAYYMISKNVELYETNQKIKSLQNELTQIETYTSQRIFELEQSVDLATVEEIATTKLNMQRPEQYQIEYVSIERDDVTEITAGEVEGVKSRVGNATKNLKRNLIGIFTIGQK